MTSFKLLTPLAVFATALIVSAGCSSESEPAAPAVVEQTAEMKEALASLAPEDLALVEFQHGVCPVSGEALGSMGLPVKVTVGDKSLLVCCAGCEEEANDKFDALYAKLHEKTAP